ncbi:MAG: RNA-binding protein, partial [Candidatus Pacebacteria bacterium]|nr:RNA-binding protein [Candidatus Paceibacterota bacterium]
MEKKLYVGNLPYETSEDNLKELFSEAGTVESAAIIMDKFSGRSKGFGFV